MVQPASELPKAPSVHETNKQFTILKQEAVRIAEEALGIKTITRCRQKLERALAELNEGIKEQEKNSRLLLSAVAQRFQVSDEARLLAFLQSKNQERLKTLKDAIFEARRHCDGSLTLRPPKAPPDLVLKKSNHAKQHGLN